MEEQSAKKKERELYSSLKKNVESGSTLSEAFREVNLFSQYECISIEIGEEGGNITAVLQELANFFQSRIKYKRQFIGALTYPIIVFATAMIIVWVMLTYVVPMFSDVFKRFGKDLPFLTQLVVDASAMIRNYWWAFLSVPLGIFGFIRFNAKKEWFRKLSSSFLLGIPIFGRLTRQLYLIRFCSSMKLLLDSKVPLLRALELTETMIGFYPLEVAIRHSRSEILKGEAFYDSLKGFKIFDKTMLALIKVGEEVNHLPKFFRKLEKQYSDEVEYQTSNLNTIIEPVLIIFLGLIVGVILIAMYLPLFSMGGSMGEGM